MQKVFIFTAGCVLGAGVTYLSLKGKYEKLINDEVNSLRTSFQKSYEEQKKQLDELIAKQEAELRYETVIENAGYKKVETKDETENVETSSMVPYIISEEEYASTSFNEKVSLTFYQGDEILTDDNDEIIKNIDEAIGYSNTDYFDRYDVDVIYVRNERLSIDYEVVRDVRAFSDYIGEQ